MEITFEAPVAMFASSRVKCEKCSVFFAGLNCVVRYHNVMLRAGRLTYSGNLSLKEEGLRSQERESNFPRAVKRKRKKIEEKKTHGQRGGHVLEG